VPLRLRHFLDSSGHLPLPESNDHSRAKPQVVLVIVEAVVEGGEKIVCFDEANREAAVCAEIDSAAEVDGKRGGGIRCGRGEFAACMCHPHQQLTEWLPQTRRRSVAKPRLPARARGICAQRQVVTGCGD